DWDPDARYTMSEYAADLVALVGALRLQRFFVIAHSMGGFITLVYAAEHAEEADEYVRARMPAQQKTVKPAHAAQLRKHADNGCTRSTSTSRYVPTGNAREFCRFRVAKRSKSRVARSAS